MEQAIELMKNYGVVLQEEAEEQAKDLVDVFSDTVADEAADRKSAEKIGSAGVRLINYLEDGIESEKGGISAWMLFVLLILGAGAGIFFMLGNRQRVTAMGEEGEGTDTNFQDEIEEYDIEEIQ